jgi:putative transposase
VYEAIRTAQFVRNSCLRYWINNKNVGRYDLNKYCALQARDFPIAYELNSMARLASAERAGSAISRFSDNCKKGNLVKKDIHSSRKIAALLSTKQQDGNLQKTPNQSTFPTIKGLDG